MLSIDEIVVRGEDVPIVVGYEQAIQKTPDAADV
jgi:hypothetical protein